MKINLNRQQKAILLIGIVVFSILIWNRATSKKEELQEGCKELTSKNLCYLSEEEIKELDSGSELNQMAKEEGYSNLKEACGCVTYNITDL
ncbi:MAG: hypothetical protein ACLFS3_02310 [Candidatus Aenigmatarchaeota archaeon]